MLSNEYIKRLASLTAMVEKNRTASYCLSQFLGKTYNGILIMVSTMDEVAKKATSAEAEDMAKKLAYFIDSAALTLARTSPKILQALKESDALAEKFFLNFLFVAVTLAMVVDKLRTIGAELYGMDFANSSLTVHTSYSNGVFFSISCQVCDPDNMCYKIGDDFIDYYNIIIAPDVMYLATGDNMQDIRLTLTCLAGGSCCDGEYKSTAVARLVNLKTGLGAVTHQMLSLETVQKYDEME